jgi:outer membrane protein assembly factor BamB/transposase InsO family protein
MMYQSSPGPSLFGHSSCVSKLCAFCAFLLLVAPFPCRAQSELQSLWTFSNAVPTEVVVPAALSDGSVVIMGPRAGISGPDEGSRIQKISSSGRLDWEHSLEWRAIGWPVIMDDSAILAAHGSPPFGVGRIQCFAADGSLRWSLDPGGSPVVPPTLVSNNAFRIVISTSELLEVLATGEVHWRAPVSTPGWGYFSPGLYLSDGQFILSMGSALASLSNTGATNWTISLQSPDSNPPAVAKDGTIVVTTSIGMLMWINPDGSLRQQHYLGLGLLPPVIADDGITFVPRTDNQVDVYDRTGTLIRQWNTPGSILDAPALSGNGRIWMSLNTGQLAGYDFEGNLIALREDSATIVSGPPLLRGDGPLVAGFEGQRLIAFADAGAPMGNAWPMVGGNPARSGRQGSMARPGKPTSVTGTPVAGGVDLGWQPNAGEGLATFEVWRASNPSFESATRLAAFLVPTAWQDEHVVAGFDYWYWVRARNAAGPGAPSDPVMVRTELPPVGSRVARLRLSSEPISLPAQGAGGTLYVGDSNGGLLAIARDGATLWRFDTGVGTGFPVGSPMIAPDGRIYFAVAGPTGGIFGVSTNGTELWRLPYLQVWEGQPWPPTPALDADGNLRFTGRRDETAWLLSVSPDGEVRQSTPWGDYLPAFSSMVIAANDSFWLGSGTLLQRNSMDDRLLWVAQGSLADVGNAPLALDADGEVLASAGGDGRLVRRASDRSVRWIAGNNVVSGGGVVDANRVSYFGDLSGLFYAVSREGTVLWSTDMGSPVSSMPALGEPNLVYVANDAGLLRALDTSSGAEQWQHDLAAQPVGALVLVEPNELAISTRDGFLHRVRLSGPVQASAPWPMFGHDAAHQGRLPDPLPVLVAPESLAATQSATNAEVVLTWQTVSGAAWYEVARSASNDLLSATFIATNFIGEARYTDLSIPLDQRHWYWVRAAGISGPGPWSEPVQGQQGRRKWRFHAPYGVNGPVGGENQIQLERVAIEHRTMRLSGMLGIVWCLLRWVISQPRTEDSLRMENLALRHQLAVLLRQRPSPRFRPSDRWLWARLRDLWPQWRSALLIVQPETVVRWHRRAFRLFWRLKSRRRAGRPMIDRDLVALIRQMWQANPTWGSPRIQAELAKLGLNASTSTIRKYRPPHHARDRSHAWATFLANHLRDTAAIDFFVVPTLTFRLLFVCVILKHERRRVVHLNVTEAPSASWTARQVLNAFPFESAPGILLRDRDGIYGSEFTRCLATLGLEDKRIAARSPWQSPYIERLIGSIRRECLDHVIILNRVHLHRLLNSYLSYYHDSRTHRALDQDAPNPRAVELPDSGKIVEFPMVGGLHHRYARQAA